MEWRQQEITALKLLTLAGELRFAKGIDLVLFRREIYDTQPSRLIALHQEAQNYSDQTLDIYTTYTVAKELSMIDNIAPARIDIGTLSLAYLNSTQSLDSWLKVTLKYMIGVESKNKHKTDVVLYGFGRIGRLAARRILQLAGRGDQLVLKAIVLRPKLSDRKAEALKRAALLSSDSVHGDFNGTIKVSDDGSHMMINGTKVHLIFAQSPEQINYTEYGIDKAIVIDNTGVWRDRKGLEQHLRPGISKVMLTAPAKGDVPNIVYGANHEMYNFKSEDILSAASCTTNAIVPTLQVLHEELDIMKGHIETVHSYTNDQNLLDNFHKKPRRGRGAPINMVMTSTGAASAVGKVIPSLNGKLSGNAIRVPTPNVSLAILNLTFSKPTTTEALNGLIKKAAFHGPLVEQIMYSTLTEFVSSDVVGVPYPSILDGPSTIVSDDGMTGIVYLWYDNEYGYTCQVVRLAKHVTEVRRYVYY